ncbi:MAG: hypothetical protein AAGM33_01945 [Pseudomonadota bacterium]
MFSVLLALAMAGENVPAPASEAAAEEKKVVCKSVHRVGSRIPERICRTNKEWTRINNDNEQQLRKRFNESRGTQNQN